MSKQSMPMRILSTPLFFWIALCIAGSYFMVSFDSKMMQEARLDQSVLGYLKKSFSSMQLSHVNKGIDLAGGTYLVLSVELEKAIENRLGAEFRSWKSTAKWMQLAADTLPGRLASIFYTGIADR